MKSRLVVVMIILTIILTSISVLAISNVQQSIDGNKLTLSYEGTPPFMINIRGDENIGSSGGYIWAKTYDKQIKFDLTNLKNPTGTFYYNVKEDKNNDSWTKEVYTVISCEDGYDLIDNKCIKTEEPNNSTDYTPAKRATYTTYESMSLKSSRPSSSFGPSFYGNIILDDSNNFYLIGAFTENLTIDNTVFQSFQRKYENMTLTNNLLGIINGDGVSGLPVLYGPDGVIAKRNSNGAWEWIKTIETKTFEAREPGINLALPKSSSIRILFNQQDSNGNIYIGGTFSGKIKFNSNIILTSYIEYDTYQGCNNCIPFGGNALYPEPFIAKINLNGEWQWAKKLANRNFNPALSPDYKLVYPEMNRGIASLNNMKIFDNKIIFTGHAQDSIKTDNVVLLKNYNYYFSGEIDFSGNLLSVKELKALPVSSTQEISSNIDNFGNVYIIDKNITKFNSTGDLLWSKELDENINSLKRWSTFRGTSAVDSNDNLYVVGMYKDNINFFDTHLLKHPEAVPSINESGFIAKIDKNGNLKWIKNFYFKYVIPNILYSSGNLFLAGDIISFDDARFGGYAYFGNFILSSYGGLVQYGNPSANKDLFVVKIDPNNGDFISADMFGDQKSSGLTSFFVKDNKIYLLGTEAENQLPINYDAPIKLFVWTQ